MGGEQYNCFVQPFQKWVMTDHNENKQGIRELQGVQIECMRQKNLYESSEKIYLRPS